MMAMPDTGADTRARPSGRLGRWLWERCTANGVLLGFLALAAAAIALSYVLPQVPAHIRADSISYREWLSAAQVRFKDWTPFLEAWGAFYILETSWFRVLLALTAFVLLVSTGNEARALFGALLAGRPGGYFAGSRTTAMASTLPPQQVVSTVRQAMGGLFHRIREETRGERLYLLGRYGNWPAAEPLVIRLGLLLVISSLALNGRWGWQQPAVQLLPGEPVSVGPRSSHRIVLLDAPAPAAEARLQVGSGRQILLRQGGAFYQGGYRYQWAGDGGPVVEVAATDEDGQALTLYDYAVRPLPAESLRLAFRVPSSPSQEESDHLFIVSEEQMVARLKWLQPDHPEAQGAAQFHLWVFREDGRTLLGDCSLTAASDTVVAVVAGVRFALRFSRYIVLDIAYQPGTWVLRVGGALAALGLAGSLIPGRSMRSMIDSRPGGASVSVEERVVGLSWGYRRRRDELLAELQRQLGRT